MWQYSVIFIVVGIAAWFTGRSLWREARQGQCSHCYCRENKGLKKTLIQLGVKPEDADKPRTRPV